MKIVKIGATWCGSCLSMKKAYAEIEEMYKDIEFVNLDLDFDAEKVKNYGPSNVIPALIFIKDDKEVGRLVGDSTKEEIIHYIELLR